MWQKLDWLFLFGTKQLCRELSGPQGPLCPTRGEFSHEHAAALVELVGPEVAYLPALGGTGVTKSCSLCDGCR